MHSGVKAIETKHDRYGADKGSLNVVVPITPIEEVVPNPCVICLWCQILQHNQQDKEAHNKNDKGKGFNSRQETPKDCGHKYSHCNNCEEGQCYVPVLHLILWMYCIGQSKNDVGCQEGHSGSAGLPCDSDYPAYEVGQKVRKPGRSQYCGPVVLTARKWDPVVWLARLVADNAVRRTWTQARRLPRLA
jgi:hypothetical protein